MTPARLWGTSPGRGAYSGEPGTLQLPAKAAANRSVTMPELPGAGWVKARGRGAAAINAPGLDIRGTVQAGASSGRARRLPAQVRINRSRPELGLALIDL